jgi:transposase
MPKAYADDLRRKVLQCHGRGEETLEELAERFAVSLGWVYKISAAYTRTGKMERQRSARLGRKRKATPEIEQLVRERIGLRPDTTLAELQVMLFEQRQLEMSIGALWNLLDRLKLRFKKKSARQPAGPARRTKAAG